MSCTVPTPGKGTSCIHLILLESPSRSEFLPSSGGFQARDFTSSPLLQIETKRKQNMTAYKSHFQGNTDLWLICLASQHKAKPIETALKKADFLLTSTRQTHSHSHFCWNTSYPDSPLPASSPPPPVSPPWPERCSGPGLGSRCVSAGPRWWSVQQPARFPVSLFPAVFPCLWIEKW